jgi:hypothetical protein
MTALTKNAGMPRLAAEEPNDDAQALVRPVAWS